MMHLATAAHTNMLRESCMGGRERQAPSSPNDNTSHEDVLDVSLELKMLPPMMAKRPSLNTHPWQPRRPALMGGSTFQVHAASCAPCRGGPHASAVESKSRLPAHTTRPSGNLAAAKLRRAWRRGACGVQTPVARSTSRTAEVCS